MDPSLNSRHAMGNSYLNMRWTIGTGRTIDCSFENYNLYVRSSETSHLDTTATFYDQLRTSATFYDQLDISILTGFFYAIKQNSCFSDHFTFTSQKSTLHPQNRTLQAKISFCIGCFQFYIHKNPLR